MSAEPLAAIPEKCPACAGELAVTQLQCTRCGTSVNGRFAPGRLVNVAEPFGSVLEMFLKVRGNVKEMERLLGLSYPTVRARLQEAFDAAGLGGNDDRDAKTERLEIVRRMGRGEISATEALAELQKLKNRR